MPEPHRLHANCVIFQHDGVQIVVTMSICEDGICAFPEGHPKNIISRYLAAGLTAKSLPMPDANLDFWDEHEPLRYMVYLKLAEYEGRQSVVDWARAGLVRLARTHTAS